MVDPMNKSSINPNEPYYSFNNFLRELFGEKVYRVAIDGGFTCPNVDGTVTTGGCVYCDNRSFSPNRRIARPSIINQVERGIRFLSKRYNCAKFLAYFQAATNTHGRLERLERLYKEALNHPQIVGLAIGTRPDSLPTPVLNLLEGIAKEKFVCLEVGLQSAHNKSLEWMNRGHDVECFVDAIHRCQNRGFNICTHVILGLPGETREDMMETARLISSLPIDGVKIHNLHVVKDTPLEKMFLDGQVRMLEKEEYISLLCDFLELLPETMSIHRVTGDAPNEFLVAPSWCSQKTQILKDIKAEFHKRGTKQGDRFSKQTQARNRRTSLDMVS